jgi:2-polyprenyl-6-methoxyphenol hydroxylase-like FAD-dependent oxidoreductase
MTTHFPIAIVGGGLGGLTLAAVLHRNGVESAIFDLDASPDARAQGGMLDMHEESGQAALRAAGLWEEFQAAVHVGGESLRVMDMHANVGREELDEGGGHRPEVNRKDLRDMLLDALPAGTARWGAKVTQAKPLGGGMHEVTLADGSAFTTDLLVGADGAWSKLRPLLSDAQPVYAGVAFVELHLDDADTRHPEQAKAVGGGAIMALGDQKAFLGHRDALGRLHLYAAIQAPADWATSSGIDFSDPEAAKPKLLEYFADWNGALRGIIAGADGPIVPRLIYALPVGHRWDQKPGITLIGDAAHLMSPFAGEGANLAMQDGSELAAALLKHGTEYDAAVADYEAAMFPRSEEAARGSGEHLETFFRPDAYQSVLDLFAGFDAQRE